jgi:ElaB/YqjD/DUF883 family membrane-anchored ribosome-binding protein
MIIKLIRNKKMYMANKQVEAMAEELKGKVVAQVGKGRAAAEKEIAKVKKQLSSTYATVENFAKKNPEKAALVAAGIGAALGAAIAMLMRGGKKKK